MRVSWRNEATYAGIHTENFTWRVTGLYQYLVGSEHTSETCRVGYDPCSVHTEIAFRAQATHIYPFLLVK